MSYTKGDWLVHQWGKTYQVVEANSHTIKKPGITMTGQKILAKEISKANAHLIAAAPELYEALEEAKLWLDMSDDGTNNALRDLIKKIDKALSKAEGKEAQVGKG